MMPLLEVQRATPRGEFHQCGVCLDFHLQGAEQVEAGVDEALWGQLALRAQAYDEALYARVVDVPELLGAEVDALDQASGIDPFLACVPAFDTRRVQEILPHVAALQRDLAKSGLGCRIVADQAHDANYVL